MDSNSTEVIVDMLVDHLTGVKPLEGEVSVKSLLSRKDVEDVLVRVMATKALSIVINSCKDPEEGVPVSPGATERALLGIKEGVPVPNNGTQEEKKNLYTTYGIIFFGAGTNTELSVKICKHLMSLLFLEAGIQPIQTSVRLLLNYSSGDGGDGIYQSRITLTADQPWMTLGMAPIVDRSHIYVPKTMVNGSRFTSIIMGVIVRGEPHLAVLYLGSLFMPYVDGIGYNSYTFEAQVDKKVSIQFKDGPTNPGPVLELIPKNLHSK